jgi:hypothetical protein
MRLYWLPLTVAAALSVGAAEAPPDQEAETCLACHGETGFASELASGEKIALTVDWAVLATSVHGKGLKCTDCHPGMDEIPHPERPVKNSAEFHAGFRDACKSCHFDKYALSLDGVHTNQLAKGNEMAPGCVDCHGSHEIARPAKPRTHGSRRRAPRVHPTSPTRT